MRVDCRGPVAVVEGASATAGAGVDLSSVFCLFRDAAAGSPSFLTLDSRGLRVFFSLTGLSLLPSTLGAAAFRCRFGFVAAAAAVASGLLGMAAFAPWATALCARAGCAGGAEAESTTPSPNCEVEG